MRLESIADFDWENEPDFNFHDGSIVIKSAENTDFWQDKRHNINTSTGHFFYCRKFNNFTIIAKWKVPDIIPQMAQFGLMSKIDNDNWCKISLTKDKFNNPFILVSAANDGISDFCKFMFSEISSIIYYKIQIIDGVISVSYSPDKINFTLLRVFQFVKESKIYDIGAYICNPSEQDFKAVLEDIDIF